MEATTTEILSTVQDRAERNYRVAKLLAAELVSAGRIGALLTDLKRELNRSGGHCGEGTSESKRRRRYENDLEAAIHVCEAVLANNPPA